jgi:hypothetical protein
LKKGHPDVSSGRRGSGRSARVQRCAGNVNYRGAEGGLEIEEVQAAGQLDEGKMLHAMLCRSLAAAGVLALAGCAQENGSRPSYIGLMDVAGATDAPDPQSSDAHKIPEALRYIQSNKVLGAMAFQRVTGRTVDPDSLSDSTDKAP